MQLQQNRRRGEETRQEKRRGEESRADQRKGEETRQEEMRQGKKNKRPQEIKLNYSRGEKTI